jgi:stage V sporulation protein G
MKITEVTIRPVTIRPTNDGVVRAYVDIVFDNCLMVRELKVIKGSTGLSVSFPAKKQRDGSDRQLAYPANAETRKMIQRAILAEYEKLVAGSEPMSNASSAAERLRSLEQLKTNGLITDEEYNTKRKEILGEL